MMNNITTKYNYLILFFTLFILTINQVQSQNTRSFKYSNEKKDSILTTRALIVGISKYAYINQLNYADDDAYTLYDFLISANICSRKDAKLLIDSAATEDNFFKELSHLIDISNKNDRVIIYFAGHGDVEPRIQSGFLLGYNCTKSTYPATDAIDIDMLEKFINPLIENSVEVILIIDACRSGHLVGGSIGANNTMKAIQGRFEKVTKLLSCQVNELSEEREFEVGEGHGIFTYCLVKGLIGLADFDGNNEISLRELDTYLLDVPKYTSDKQNPILFGDKKKVLFSVNQDILKSLKLKTTLSKTLYNSNDNLGRREQLDVMWENNKTYTKFQLQLREFKYLTPNGNNSLETITIAENNKEDSTMISTMKADLAAKMGDEAQSWINSYLRGQINNNTTKCKEDLNRYISYLKTVEQLIGKKNLRYNKIHAKRLFFEAYLLKLDGKNAKLMEALTKIQEANKKMPGQAYLYNCWGLILDDLNKTDSAILLYEAALTLSPKWAIPFSNLGAVMQKKKKYLPSEDYLKKAINLDSNYAMAYNNLGYLYSEINKINDAEKLFRKAIEIDSNLKFAYLNLAVLLKGEKKYMESLVLLDKSIKIDPEFKLGLLSLAEINIILKNYEIAEFSLKKVIEIDPNNSEIYFNLGLLYQIQKKFQLAENCYLFAWDINPKLFEAIKRLGEVLYEQQKYTESIAYYQKAIKFNKEKGNIYYNISCNFALLKNKSEALKYLEMAINNGFNDLNTLKNDTDLTSIRDEKRYKFLEEKLSKK